MLTKRHFYFKVSTVLSALVIFVGMQFFFMFPRTIIYERGSFEGKNLYLFVHNNNYRNLRLKLFVNDGASEWEIRSVVDRRSIGKIKLGEINQSVTIRDNFLNKVVFNF
ncbi:hypothetical protein COBT_000779 [Conglomerata obtusa]